VIWDASIQAAYIVHDPAKSESLARDFRDFHQVEIWQLKKRVFSHDTPISRNLKTRPDMAANLRQVDLNFQKVRARFSSGKGNAWPHWYGSSLSQIAKKIGKAAEYDNMLWHLNSSVHSSFGALAGGPCGSADRAPGTASILTARIAKLNLSHNNLNFADEYVAQFFESVAIQDFLTVGQPKGEK